MKRGLFITAAFALPMIAFAQTKIGDILDTIYDLLSAIIPILTVLALIYFIWGVAKYIMSQGDEEQQKSARGMMIWGIIALFVIVSVWGLVAILQDTVGIDRAAGPIVPMVPMVP